MKRLRWPHHLRVALGLVLLVAGCAPPAPPAPPLTTPAPPSSGTPITRPPAGATPVAQTAAPTGLGLSPDQQRSLGEARQLALQGDSAQAADVLRQLGGAAGLSPGAATEIRLELALALAAARQPDAARQVLDAAPAAADAREPYLRGMVMEAANQHPQAMASLATYATSGDASAVAAAPAVWLEIAEAELRARRPREAADATAHGLDAAQPRPLKQQLLEVRAQALAALGDTENAFDAHRQVLALATSQATLGEQLFRLAQASRDLGKNQEAVTALQTALEQFPDASTTPDALRLLDELGAADKVDPYVLGRARYAAADARNAVAAFDRSLATQPDGPDAPSAHLYRALASLTPGNEPNALRELDAIAADPSQDSEIAAQAMLEAGQALETLNQPDQAETRYAQLLQRFPRLDAAATAAFRLGLVRYVRGAYPDAVAAWDTLLARRDDLTTDQVAQALYWRGKALNSQGQTADAEGAWQQAASLRPAGYYSLRATDALGQLGGGSATLASIDDAEEAQLSSWMADRRLDLAGAAGVVGGDPALARARAEASLGLYREGNWEADELAQRYSDRADRLYWLARRFAELGLSAGATQLGQAAYDASGVQTPTDAPLALRKAANPLPFDTLVGDVANRYGLDPLLLGASLRHASQFDPWADSQVSGAHGLAMMSPIHLEETARALHASRGASQLTARDAVERQAWLVADRLRRYDGRPEVAFSVIGTTERLVDGWLARPGAEDADVFIERIDYPAVRGDLEGLLSARFAYALTYGGTASDPLAVSLPKPEPTDAWVKIARFGGDLPPAAPIEAAAQVGTADQQAAFARGATLQRDGDPQAIDVFQKLASASDPAVVSAAQLRLGEALLTAGRPADAIDPLSAVAADFLLGRALGQLGRCAEAVPVFERFIAANPPPLAAQGRVAEAACLQDLGQFDDAVAQLSSASQVADLPRLQVLDIRERLALARLRAGDVDGARADYSDLLAGARTNSYRAELNYYLGVLAPEAATAATRLRTALQTDPRGHGGQAALDELVALGDPASRSFEAGDARFEQSRYREALAAYTGFAQANPGDGRAAKAAYGRGVSLVRLSQDRVGIGVLEQMASRFPGTPDAADGLFRGGRIRESLADLDGAAASYAAVTALPGGGGARGLDAQFRLAFVQFRQGKYADAATGWRSLSTRATQADARAQALFWLGKALSAVGDAAGARAAWTSASSADPAGFYSLRAADELTTAATPHAAVDRTQPLVERHATDDLATEIGAWAASRGGSTPAAARAKLSADAGFARANQLLALGLRREAIWELDALAGRLGNDVGALAQLGAWEQSRGLYNTALVLGFSLAGSGNVNLLTGAPAVRKLVYPLVHPVALAAAARQQHVDPLLFSALMRQESNFDQDVESAAQARGLSQLIASTAYDAARALGLYQFQTTDLFQPQTSITLGAYTFEQRLARYDQQIFPALAAYNATQYAVDGWLLAAGSDDIDTFAEAIPFTETYPYVQRIYENYRQYLELYGTQANP